MPKTILLASLLVLAGCAASPNTDIPLRTNQVISTSSADRYTCEAPNSLICREVLGSRVSHREQDCVCQP